MADDSTRIGGVHIELQLTGAEAAKAQAAQASEAVAEGAKVADAAMKAQLPTIKEIEAEFERLAAAASATAAANAEVAVTNERTGTSFINAAIGLQAIRLGFHLAKDAAEVFGESMRSATDIANSALQSGAEGGLHGIINAAHSKLKELNDQAEVFNDKWKTLESLTTGKGVINALHEMSGGLQQRLEVQTLLTKAVGDLEDAEKKADEAKKRRDEDNREAHKKDMEEWQERLRVVKEHADIQKDLRSAQVNSLTGEAKARADMERDIQEIRLKYARAINDEDKAAVEEIIILRKKAFYDEEKAKEDKARAYYEDRLRKEIEIAQRAADEYANRLYEAMQRITDQINQGIFGANQAGGDSSALVDVLSRIESNTRQ